jgi:hypothetical protein
MNKRNGYDPGVSQDNINIAAKQYRAAMARNDINAMTAASVELWHEELAQWPSITDALFDTFADAEVREAVLTGMRRGFCLGLEYGMQVYREILIQGAKENDQ